MSDQGDITSQQQCLLVAASDVLSWLTPCEACDGVGRSRYCPDDVCEVCGGYGERVSGDIMEALLTLREAVERETHSSQEDV